MKRLAALVSALALLLAGCGGAAPTSQQPGRLRVAATIFPLYDLARRIAGEAAEVTLLLPPGGEAHGFEPSLTTLAAVESADVVLYNGGESDAFVLPLLSAANPAGKTCLRLMDEVPTRAEEDPVSPDHPTQDEPDEHIWTDPHNAAAMAEAITRTLCAANPARRAEYEAGYAALRGELDDVITAFDALPGGEAPPLLVADRFPFLYMTAARGWRYLAAFSGCTSNTEADLQTLARLIAAARQRARPVVLCTEFSDRRLARAVAEATGGRVATLHSCHNVTLAEYEAGESYCSLMRRNCEILKEALAA